MIGISKLANSDLDIIITQIDQIGYEKYKVPFEYNSIEDIIKQENLKKSSRGVPSRVFHRDGEIYIQANLLNGTSSSHDPGIGYVSSRSYLIRKLDDNIKINIIGHRRDDLFFNKTDNKLINVLKLTGVTIQFENDECIIIERETGLYDKSYWRYSTTGEKIASILMEKIYENNGYKVIFTNHAGCGKSYVKINDEFFQTTGGSGLPDLVLYKSETNELIVIEGETSNNYQKGLKQVKDQNFNDFIQREFINRLPIGLTIKKYLCTYGDYKNEPEVLFNLNDKFEITINENVISIE
jgi:hypothetical protein